MQGSSKDFGLWWEILLSRKWIFFFFFELQVMLNIFKPKFDSSHSWAAWTWNGQSLQWNSKDNLRYLSWQGSWVLMGLGNSRNNSNFYFKKEKEKDRCGNLWDLEFAYCFFFFFFFLMVICILFTFWHYRNNVQVCIVLREKKNPWACVLGILT